jgi:integrase/recombinase XerD
MMFERHVLEYLIYLVGKGRAQETVRWRRSPLSMFGRYLSRQGTCSIADVSRDLVDDYLATLKSGAFNRSGKPLSAGSYRDHLIALNDFFKWLASRGKLLINPAEDALREVGRLPVRLPHALTVEEMEKVIGACTPTTALGLRDRAVLEVLYSTGIRKRELVRLDISDFRSAGRELLIRDGKGGKDRVVPLGEYAWSFTEAYIRLVRPWQVSGPEEKALFLQHRSGRRFALRCVGDIVERAAAKSGVGRRVSPHVFRHTMATHMLRNRADLRHIQAILGHADLRSTQIYTEVSIEDLKEVMRRAHPHGRRTQRKIYEET